MVNTIQPFINFIGLLWSSLPAPLKAMFEYFLVLSAVAFIYSIVKGWLT